MSHKPTIRYSEIIVPPAIGGRAMIKLAEPHHTLSDAALEYYGWIVTTSEVQEVEAATGSFWTKNTHYVPVDFRKSKWNDPHKGQRQL